MTFETEEGVERAKAFQAAVDASEDLQRLKLDLWLQKGYKIEIQEASEPSDIIWENRQFTPEERRRKELCTFIGIALMLLASFMVIFKLSDISNKAIEKYPLFDE